MLKSILANVTPQDVCLCSCSALATPCTVARQALLSLGFSRQEFWNGLPFPSPEDLLNLGIKPKSPVLEGRFFTTVPPGKPCTCICSSDSTLNWRELKAELLSKLGETGVSVWHSQNAEKEPDYIIQTSLLLLVFVLPLIPLSFPLQKKKKISTLHKK